MSGRRIGGGRVLGSSTSSSGQTLSPTTAALAKQTQSTRSPSGSSLSLGSLATTSSPSNEHQDITSQVSWENHAPPTAAAAAAASSKLVCPICNDEMVTLLQLNRHLDDNHQNLEEVKQDEVKDWFKVQMIKARKFQPLAVINQKLKGLDVFESNNTLRAVSPLPISTSSTASPQSRPPEPAILDPDEVVSHAHWQRPSSNDACAEPMCGKRLNSTNGKINCRHCGKLFCEEHTMYEMRLSRSAQHEPVHGLWCRVCETCYKSRDGYNDHTGVTRDDTADFAAMRRGHVDKTLLEVSRLEKRLTRLTQLLSNPPEQPASARGLLWPLSPLKTQRKELEQSVVMWEQDADVPRCPFCQQDFSSYTFRRHHCRTCGRIVCGDPTTGCSSELALQVAAVNDDTEKSAQDTSLDIRICRDCRHTLFSRKDFAAELAQNSPDIRAYSNLLQFEQGIRMLLPKFHRLLGALQDPEHPPTPGQLAEASKVRKRLMEAFTQYDLAARRLRDLPTTSPTQQRLQKAVFQRATSFLHLHMLPLKSLPKILKHASPHGAATALSPNGSRPATGARKGSNNALESIRNSDLDMSSQISSSSAVSALEEEERALRERLIVLEEQKFFVSEMVADANRRRRFDEASSLSGNLHELAREIDSLQGQLAQLDFAGAYQGLGPLDGAAAGSSGMGTFAG